MLWFAWKFVPLWYQQQLGLGVGSVGLCCDLLENSYLCGISNNCFSLSNCTFGLWFAWKFVPLWYQQQQELKDIAINFRCDLLENSYLCGISNNAIRSCWTCIRLWFAWKFVPLWYQQQLITKRPLIQVCCDLLENSYLCGISNNLYFYTSKMKLLWFAWKFVPLWYQQQPRFFAALLDSSCDLLENSYLCGISNNPPARLTAYQDVVICLKIRTFVVSATTSTTSTLLTNLLWFAWKFVPLWYQQQQRNMEQRLNFCCDLLENSYLCGISNNRLISAKQRWAVVICLKIRTFVVSATTWWNNVAAILRLWFAWKFVPLWYQQQLILSVML